MSTRLGISYTIELIEPIRRHQARIVETPEQIEALVNELSLQSQSVLSSGTITGQWVDYSDGDVSFFRQSGNHVVGFYNYGSGNRKVGVYVGTINKGVFEYQWKWLNGQLNGYGRMKLSKDYKKLSGEWWYDKNKKEAEHVEYHRVSDKMPSWLNDEDFKEYSDFLKVD